MDAEFFSLFLYIGFTNIPFSFNYGASNLWLEFESFKDLITCSGNKLIAKRYLKLWDVSDILSYPNMKENMFITLELVRYYIVLKFVLKFRVWNKILLSELWSFTVPFGSWMSDQISARLKKFSKYHYCTHTTSQETRKTLYSNRK